MNGASSVTIDGNVWMKQTDASANGYSAVTDVSGVSTSHSGLSPVADADTTKMLNRGIVSSQGFTLEQTVPAV